jgi:hypothetical protein
MVGVRHHPQAAVQPAVEGRMQLGDNLRMPMAERMDAARGAAIQQAARSIDVPDMRALAPAEHEFDALLTLPPGD